MLSQHFEGNYKNSGTNNYSSDGDAKDMKYCISQGYDGVTKWNNGTYACTRFDPSNNGECYWCKNDNDGEYYPKIKMIVIAILHISVKILESRTDWVVIKGKLII